MKKSLLSLCAMATVLGAYADSGIMSSTPEGTLYPDVYGISERTYLIAQGGFGSFSDNAGYRSSIVVNGEDIYIHNIIREFPGIDSWVKGHKTADNRYEFEFPQPVAVDSNTGETLYASMIGASVAGSIIDLTPDAEAPNLVLEYDGSKYTQVLPGTSTGQLAAYDGMIGLINGNGVFMSYGEKGVSYSVWDEAPAVPSEDLKTETYTATYTDEWNESHKGIVKIGIDGDTAWINGLCSALPESWVKGTVAEDGSITLASDQYLGIANEYFYFFFGAKAEGTVDYSWTDATVLTPVENGYEASAPMMINLGETRPWFGNGIANLKLSLVVAGDPVPVNPVFGEPEWDPNDEMGVADVLISPEDINGQALDPENLYYRVFFNGEPAELAYDEEGNPIYDLQYGKDYDLVLFMYDWHFIIFMEPLQSIGVQSVYKTADGEYCSEVVTYEFPSVGVDGIASGKEVSGVQYFNIAGAEVADPSGICIRKVTYSDGTVAVSKIMKR